MFQLETPTQRLANTADTFQLAVREPPTVTTVHMAAD